MLSGILLDFLSLNIAVFVKPFDLVTQSFHGGPRRIAELTARFLTREVHEFARHANAVYCQHGFAVTSKPRYTFPDVSYGCHEPVRQPNSRWPLPGKFGNSFENPLECPILASENIAFTDRSFFVSQQVTGRHIVDVDDIEPGIDISRHPARGRFDNHSTGRGRLDITGSERRGGLYRDYRALLLDHQAPYFSFG